MKGFLMCSLLVALTSSCTVTSGPPPAPALSLESARWTWEAAGRAPDDQRFLLVGIVASTPDEGPTLPLDYEHFSLRTPPPEGVSSIFDLRGVHEASPATPDVDEGCLEGAVVEPGDEVACTVAFEIEASPAPEELVYAPPESDPLAAFLVAIEEPVACDGYRNLPTDLCGACLAFNCPTAAVQDCGPSCTGCADVGLDDDACGCLASSCEQGCAERVDRHLACRRDLCREHCLAP